MKRLRTAVVAFVSVAAIGAAAHAEAGEIKSESATIRPAGLNAVDIEHAVGELDIRASAGRNITITMTVSCGKWFSGKCRDQAERLELDTETVDDQLLIRVRNMPHSVKSLSVDMEIEMSASLGVRIEHGVGETRIVGIEGDIDVELGVGDVYIESDASHFERVSIEVGVGDADFRHTGNRVGRTDGFLFLGNSVEWDDGKGESAIEVEVGVGDAEVRLE